MTISNLMSDEKLKEYFAFQAPYLEEKLYKEGKFNSQEDYNIAFTELKKYFLLLQLKGKDTPMGSEKVDAVWHQFILFTMAYHKFCNYFFGEFIHHLPNTSFTPMKKSKEISFSNRYKEVFGDEIHEVWGHAAACDGGGCSGCRGGCNGCSKCKSEDSFATVEEDSAYQVLNAKSTKGASIVSLESSCHSCNGCGRCHGCNGCKGE